MDLQIRIRAYTRVRGRHRACGLVYFPAQPRFCVGTRRTIYLPMEKEDILAGNCGRAKLLRSDSQEEEEGGSGGGAGGGEKEKEKQRIYGPVGKTYPFRELP